MARRKVIDILLVQSGPTDWDLQDRISGNADLPLVAGSIAMPSALPDGVSEREIAAVLSAPDEASKVTAAALASRFSARHRVVPTLADLDLGLWQGMTVAELERRYTAAFGQWRGDPRLVVAPEGEQTAEAQERLALELSKAVSRRRSGSLIVVVVRPLARAILKLVLTHRPITKLWGEFHPGEVATIPLAAPELISVSGDNLSARRPVVARFFF